MNYIGYTCRHLYQRVEEHKHSVIGKQFRDVHGLKEQCHEDFAVLGQFCAKIITLRL